MTYILEGIREANRLDLQSKIRAYSLDEEMTRKRLPRANELNILDAGCGHGMVSRYLAQHSPHAKITGCDFSDLRIQQAKKMTSHSNVTYVKSDVQNLSFKDAEFDYLICRYVFEYFRDPKRALDEFHRVIAPNGRVIIIAFDGVFFNLTTQNKAFNQKIKNLELELSKHVDLYIGRKLPGLAKLFPFKKIKTTIDSFLIEANQMELEIENMKERFFLSQKTFESFMGRKEFETFQDQYLKEMEKPHTTLFYNKFILECEKGQQNEN